MNGAVQITSAQNTKVKLIKRLRSKRGREAEKRFLVDYQRDLRRALDCGYSVDFLLHCAEFGSRPLLPNTDIYEIAPQIMKDLSYRENPDSIVAVLHSKPQPGLSALELARAAHVVVLVDLRVPGNIGALLRTADAAGLDAVILVDTALDRYNANIIRSSTGACFLDNVYKLSSDDAIAFLQSGAFQVFAADAQGDASIYDLSIQGKTAIVLGAEDRGLSSNWRQTADRRVKIPMAGRLSDSLNVSACGAVFMYELYRQRQAKRVIANQKGDAGI